MLLDEDKVQASLSFKVAPDLARAFGKDGVAAIQRAKGRLVDAEITGDDAGGRIEEARAAGSDLAAERDRIEKQLASGGLGKDEAATLRARVEELRSQELAARQSQAADRASLSNTPMTFNYDGDTQFRFGGNPLADGAHAFWASVVAIVTVVLVGAGYLLPWLLVGALVLIAWRSRAGRWLRRWVRNPAERDDDG